MKIVSFTQKSEEWLEWRKGGIGASDIAVLTGSNGYTTPLKLWEIKCGFRESDPINAAMAHGIQHENMARQWMNEHFQFNLKPTCIEDPKKSHFRASLDGYDFDSDTLVEIKCPVSESILDKARISQSIPNYWFDQIQWQIMLSEPKKAMIAIWDYRHQGCITLDMFGMTKKIEKMRSLADDFWHHVQIGKAPEPNKSDYIEISDPILHQLLLEYQELLTKGSGIDGRKKEIRKQLEDFGSGNNFIANGFKVQRASSRTTYDIDKMRMDGIDVDLYAKKNKSPGSYRIFPPKNKGRLK